MLDRSVENNILKPFFYLATLFLIKQHETTTSIIGCHRHIKSLSRPYYLPTLRSLWTTHQLREAVTTSPTTQLLHLLQEPLPKATQGGQATSPLACQPMPLYRRLLAHRPRHNPSPQAIRYHNHSTYPSADRSCCQFAFTN